MNAKRVCFDVRTARRADVMGSFVGHVDEATFFLLLGFWWMFNKFPRHIQVSLYTPLAIYVFLIIINCTPPKFLCVYAQ